MSLTYAIGDIHGSLDKLERLMLQCEQDAAGQPATFIFLGDYIDRGPHSAGVIAYLIEMQRRFGDRVITLKGNHEAMAVGVIDGEAPIRMWFVGGGEATLESYGGIPPGELPHEHVEWMRSLRLSHDDGRRLFVHAGIDPEQPLTAQVEAVLLWIREPFLSHTGDYGRLVVHGHTPQLTGAPDLRSNRLNIDTAAVFGGPLTAAVFDDTQAPPVRILQAW
jgi:serine/threonine protein phosphatase 1